MSRGVPPVLRLQSETSHRPAPATPLQGDGEPGLEPFLSFSDGAGRRHVRILSAAASRLTVGRRVRCDLSLAWDEEVSRLHATFERNGEEWTVVDDGSSQNGSFVNGRPVMGGHSLHDGDAVRFGATLVGFRDPREIASRSTARRAARLTDVQRRILVALCRTFEQSNGLADPATDRQIADEALLDLEAVTTQLEALYEKSDVAQLPTTRWCQIVGAAA